jgi:putative tryptophan/tyrosine transport system substrate-binding protein
MLESCFKNCRHRAVSHQGYGARCGLSVFPRSFLDQDAAQQANAEKQLAFSPSDHREAGHRRADWGVIRFLHYGGRDPVGADQMATGTGRRQFIAALGGAAVGWPLATRAQQTRDMRTVGVIMSVAENDAESQTRIAALRQGFEELGWKDGQNVHIEYRWVAGKNDLIEQYTQEIVALRPDVILANGTGVVVALQKITSTIPIVCVLVNDPVGLGFVKNLARPGGNITGFTFIDPELISKWMALLKESTPGLNRSALLFNPLTAPYYRTFLSEIEAARLAGPLDLAAMPVGTPEEMDTIIKVLGQKPGSSLIIPPDAFLVVRIPRIAQLAADNRLPAISVYRPFAVAGGLMSYGPDTADIFRRSATYVDRILKGTSPAGLPVQQPTKFDFVINLKAAKELGLNLPPTLLALADEVIA